MKVDFFSLQEQYKCIKPRVLSAIEEIFDTQKFILGKNISEFEKEFAKYCGTRYSIAVSSGTDALLAALMALEIGPGDEVIIPDFTFFATAGVVARLHAKPVFADITLDTFSICPESIRQKITNRTKAIIPVHIFGQCADMNSIQKIANEYNIPIIEDCAQAVGTEYVNGKKAGNLGLMGCFSFYPTKNLGGAGDSGAITTNDDVLYEKLIQMRNHGMSPKYYHSFVGGNFRMDEIQAAVLLAKLPFVDNWNSLRRKNSLLYKKYFAENKARHGCVKSSLPIGTNAEAVEYVTEPIFDDIDSSKHTFHQYCILVERRDELKQFLLNNNVYTDIYYPVPLHLQACFSQYEYNDSDFSNTKYVCQHILALPIYPEISEQAISEVANKITEFFYTKTIQQ